MPAAAHSSTAAKAAAAEQWAAAFELKKLLRN
jgi:hypothetical protein